MPTITPISRDTYDNKRWKRRSDYKFTGSEAVAPLVVNELPRAAASLPIGFVAQGEHFVPATVLGLAPGQNLLVAPDGRWLTAAYIPAVFRSYPFMLARVSDDREVLCVLEDSGLVTDGPEGEAFFDESGEPSRSLADVMSESSGTASTQRTLPKLCLA